MAAYTALTKPSDCFRKPGDIISLPMVNTEVIYKGDMVRILASGEATSSTAPAQYDMFAGVAIETVDNADDGKYIKVCTTGVHSFTKDTPLQEDVGCLAYVAVAANQQTVLIADGAAAGGSVTIGAVVGLDPKVSTKVRVLIRPFLTLGDAS
jgi:hypothetical protein